MVPPTSESSTVGFQMLPCWELRRGYGCRAKNTIGKKLRGGHGLTGITAVIMEMQDMVVCEWV